MSDKNLENEQNNIVIDNDGKEIKPKKINFFRKVWYSIVKFDKYVEMTSEGTGRALKYLLQIVSIFVLIIACIGLVNTNKNLDSFTKNIEENVPNFKYSDGKITLDEVEESKAYMINDKNLNFGKIIIDLNTEDENTILEYEDTIKDDTETNNMGIIILKDKVIQLAEGTEGETRIVMTYDELIQNLFGQTNIELTKESLLDFIKGNGRTSILIINFFAYFIAYFVIYIFSGLIYAFVLSIIGYISAKITKIKLTFSQMFSISIYAFTLSNVLNMIYFIVNYFAGITIKYFDIAYIAIAYIYLVTILFLMKTDFLRKQENEVKNDKKEEKEETDGQEQI